MIVGGGSRGKKGEREDWELSVSSLSRTNVVIIWLLLMSLSNYYLLATSWQVQDAGSSIHERFYERFYGLEGDPLLMFGKRLRMMMLLQLAFSSE